MDNKLLENYNELKALFGKNFLGIEEIEKAFTSKKGKKLLEFDSDFIAQAKHALYHFAMEDDMQTFLENTKNKPEQIDEWMLILHTDRLYNINIASSTPLTMQVLSDRFIEFLEVDQSEYKLLLPNEDAWYINEWFFKSDVLSCGWILTTKNLVKETLNKDNTAQTFALAHFAHQNKLFFDENLFRATPLEILYKYFVYVQITGEKLLELNTERTIYWWQDQFPICIGQFENEGAILMYTKPEDSLSFIGSSFSRKSNYIISANASQ